MTATEVHSSPRKALTSLSPNKIVKTPRTSPYKRVDNSPVKALGRIPPFKLAEKLGVQQRIKENGKVSLLNKSATNGPNPIRNIPSSPPALLQREYHQSLPRRLISSSPNAEFDSPISAVRKLSLIAKKERSAYARPGHNASTLGSEDIAYRLRLRLRFAYYKVVTNQKKLPLTKLPPPDSWSIQEFVRATASNRRSNFRFQSFQPQNPGRSGKESTDSAAQSLLNLAN